MFVVARHAHAGDKRTWADDDRLRPLSEAGRQQAEGLAENLLSLMQPQRLVSSPYIRCLQSLAPLSKRSSRLIESSNLLTPDTPPQNLARLLSYPSADLTVFCTHGETIRALLCHWEAENGISLLADGNPVEATHTEKGGAWLVLTENEWVAHYIRPLHIGPTLSVTAHAS